MKTFRSLSPWSASRSRALALFSCASALTAIAFACDSGQADDVSGGTADGSAASTSTDVAVPQGEASTPTVTARFVHLASNLDAVDFCVRSSVAEAFTGPVLGGGTPSPDAGVDGNADASSEAAALDATTDAETTNEAEAGTADGGATPALAPRTMTNYLTFDGSGTFEVALIPGGQATCSNPLATLLVTLDPGKLATVALAGVYAGGASDGSAGSLALLRFVDDPTSVPSSARVRLIHAALGTSVKGPAGSLTVSAKGAESPVLATQIDPSQVAAAHGTSPATDMLGYTVIAPVPPATALVIAPAIGADAAGATAWTSAFTDLGLNASSLHTGFIVSDDTDDFSVVWCSDESTVGKRIDCRTVGKPAGDQ